MVRKDARNCTGPLPAAARGQLWGEMKPPLANLHSSSAWHNMQLPITLEFGGLASPNHGGSLVVCALHIHNNSIIWTVERAQGLAEVVAVLRGVINHHQNHAVVLLE